MKTGIRKALFSKSAGSPVAIIINARPATAVNKADNHLGNNSVLKTPIPQIAAPNIVDEKAVIAIASDISEKLARRASATIPADIHATRISSPESKKRLVSIFLVIMKAMGKLKNKYANTCSVLAASSIPVPSGPKPK